MPFRTISTRVAASVMLVGAASSANAETSYGEFYRMNEDQRWDVMIDAVSAHTDVRERGNEAKRFCMAQLFSNVMHVAGTDQAPLGYRTTLSVLEFEWARRMNYRHEQSVEDVIDRVIELYCPPESKRRP